MKISKRILAGAAGTVLAIAALAGPVPGHAGEGYHAGGPVAVHYRDRGDYYYRYRDHYRHDYGRPGRAYGRHYVAPPHRHYRSYYRDVPRYYGPRHYYDDGRGVWDFTLRYRFYD